MIPYLVFGLVGPPATVYAISLSLAGLLSWKTFVLAYGILLLPFLICAHVDRAMHRGKWWERMIVASFLGFVLSGIAVAVAGALLFRFGFGIGAMALGFYAIVPAAICSLLVSMSRLPAPPPREERRRPDWG